MAIIAVVVGQVFRKMISMSVVTSMTSATRNAEDRRGFPDRFARAVAVDDVMLNCVDVRRSPIAKGVGNVI